MRLVIHLLIFIGEDGSIDLSRRKPGESKTAVLKITPEKLKLLVK